MLPTFGGYEDISQFLKFFLRSNLFLRYPGYLSPSCENDKEAVEDKVKTVEMKKLTVHHKNYKIFTSICPMLINDSNVLFLYLYFLQGPSTFNSTYVI